MDMKIGTKSVRRHVLTFFNVSSKNYQHTVWDCLLRKKQISATSGSQKVNRYYSVRWLEKQLGDTVYQVDRRSFCFFPQQTLVQITNTINTTCLIIRKQYTYQILDFLKAKTFSICQMIQKTPRSSNLSFKGNITRNTLVHMKS